MTYLADPYLDRVDELSNQLRNELITFNNSGHAFILFDSPITAGKVQKVFG